MNEDLELAGRAALAGGRAAMAFWRDDDLAVDDDREGPVTAADRASHEAIAAILAAERPGDAVRSEEARTNGEPAPAAGRLWVVDPLDGTREFIDRIGEFSVMVGLAVDGEARLGAVYRPVPDLLSLGEIGRGAVIREGASTPDARERPLAAPDGGRPPYRLARSRSHPDERLTRLEEALEARVIESGSAGTKCCLVAEGDADLYVHPVPYLKEWDTCAPEAVARAAGARVTDCFGDPLQYGKAGPRQGRGIFVAAPSVYADVAPIVAEAAEGL